MIIINTLFSHNQHVIHYLGFMNTIQYSDVFVAVCLA